MEHLPHAVSVCSAAVLHYKLEDGWGLSWHRDTGHGPRCDCGSTEITPTADTDNIPERAEGERESSHYGDIKILKTSLLLSCNRAYLLHIRYSWRLILQLQFLLIVTVIRGSKRI